MSDENGIYTCKISFGSAKPYFETKRLGNGNIGYFSCCEIYNEDGNLVEIRRDDKPISILSCVQL